MCNWSTTSQLAFRRQIVFTCKIVKPHSTFANADDLLPHKARSLICITPGTARAITRFREVHFVNYDAKDGPTAWPVVEIQNGRSGISGDKALLMADCCFSSAA